MPLLGELALDLVGDALDARGGLRVEPLHPAHDGFARFGIELGEGQILQLLAYVLHADAARERRVDLDRLLRDALARLGTLDVRERAHIVQAVRELHQEHADVVRHRQHQFAEILGLLGALGEKLELRELGHAVHEPRDLAAEILLDVLYGGAGVLHRVVQQRGRDGRGVELQIGEDARDFQRDARNRDRPRRAFAAHAPAWRRHRPC